MDDNKAHNGKPNGNSKRALALVSIGTILAATGGPFLVVKLGGPSIYRDDPFTGSQGQVVAARLDAHEQRITSLEEHVDPRNHPDGELRRLINEIKQNQAGFDARQETIIKNQDWIRNKLDSN